LALPEVVPISLSEFEKDDAGLAKARAGRSVIEYYFTCTPSLPLYVFRGWPQVDLLTYVDADLFFFGDPSAVYEELGDNSLLIVGHRFPPDRKDLETFGIYNVGLVSFRRDGEGLRCLEWWRERCLEWCCDRREEGRFADQKYLDDWPARFRRVVVLQHKGAGLAPWNVRNYALSLERRGVRVDGQELVFFHFHAFRQLGRWLYDPHLQTYGVRPDGLLKQHIYGPYIRELKRSARWIARRAGVDPDQIRVGWIRRSAGAPGVEGSGNCFRRGIAALERWRSLARRVRQGDCWLVIGERVL
jgi:hypothetical protein